MEMPVFVIYQEFLLPFKEI